MRSARKHNDSGSQSKNPKKSKQRMKSQANPRKPPAPPPITHLSFSPDSINCWLIEARICSSDCAESLHSGKKRERGRGERKEGGREKDKEGIASEVPHGEGERRKGREGGGRREGGRDTLTHINTHR